MQFKNNNEMEIKMSQTRIDAEKKILEMQRELMNEIMDYQIAYGAGTVAWNVNVGFVMKEKL